MSHHRGHHGEQSTVLVLDRAWFNVPLPLKQCSLKELATTIPTKEQLDNIYQEAQEALDQEVATAQHDRGRWYMQQFQTRGTVSDKVASAAVKLCDFDFMFFMDGFNLLFETAKTDTHHFDAALKALSAVWPKLLPARPLKKFSAQHFATLPAEGQDRKKVLVYWYLEDSLKRTYGQFLSLCEGMLKDKLLHRREAWLDIAGKLLLSIAESRNLLIAMIVDKLGDPNSGVGHKAYHHLLAMLTESSTHQTVLLTELEKLVFTKNCPLRPMRFCLNVMAQFVFSKDERKLALKIVQSYLLLFRELVMTERVEQTVTSAIITGIRRAFPYSGTDYAPLAQHIDALFVLANTASFAQRVSTLGLLQNLITKGTPASFSDRWYRALYQSLLVSPKHIPNAAHLTGFFTMIYKALRTDSNSARVTAFVQRLVQRCIYFSEAFICAVLLLVGELVQTNPMVKKLLQNRPIETGSSTPAKVYDPKHRDPQHCGATNSTLWVLNTLTRHSHPSVVKLAVLILFGEELAFDSHPLDDISLSNFLNMFVDAKQKDVVDGTQVRDSHSKGVPVFRRAVHIPSIPSASDSYFVQADPEMVDVGAIFVHRYAVQRQRFLDGLAQVKSSWGDACGEDEVPANLTSCDALFGPEGGATKGTKDEKVPKNEKKAPKSTETNADEQSAEDQEEEDEEAASAAPSSSVSDDEEFDADPDEADLSWGSEDDAAYEDFEASTDEEEDDDEEAIGGRKKRAVAGDIDADDFDTMIDENRAVSKKRQREEAWLDSATQSHRKPFGREGGMRGGMRGGVRGGMRGGVRGRRF